MARTTLTLDPDVQRLLEEETHRQRKPFKQVVNEALRRALQPASPAGRAKRFRVVPHRATLAAGIDPGSFNRLADDLEIEATGAKLRRRR